MTKRTKTAALIGSVPSDLIAMYENDKLIQIPELRINVLPWDDAYEYTGKTLSLPIFSRLKLWVLDDANDTNPFCYISNGPCTGKIIHMCHDDGARIAFNCLGEFLDELSKLGKASKDIDCIERKEIKMQLNEEIAALMADGSDDAIEEMLIYLPACIELNPSTKQAFVENDDLFIREGFAYWLQSSATAGDVGFAEKLTTDKFPQVVNPAKNALKRLRNLGNGG